MTDIWSARADAYRESRIHREGADLDLLVEWAGPGEGRTALDVATGGGHLARALSNACFSVTTTDRAPGMRPDVICSAEYLLFADSSFDIVACRIAAHHFDDVQAAVDEMARVSRDLVLLEDGLYISEAAEEVDRLRDPTHVRCYSEPEWRGFFAAAGLEVEEIRVLDRLLEVEHWLSLTGCDGDDAHRVRELAKEFIEGDYLRASYILLKGRKR